MKDFLYGMLCFIWIERRDPRESWLDENDILKRQHLYGLDEKILWLCSLFYQ